MIKEVIMSAKIQCIKRSNGSRQWLVTVPAHFIHEMDIREGEEVDWYSTGRGDLVMYRSQPEERQKEKKGRVHSSA